jgi:hypothetical protein
VIRDGTVLVDVPIGQLPITGDETTIIQTTSIKPTQRLQIDSTLTRCSMALSHHAAFNNHIIRSKWNYQFTPALSVRIITQYNGLLPHPAQSSLTTTKNLNFDFLITYLAGAPPMVCDPHLKAGHGKDLLERVNTAFDVIAGMDMLTENRTRAWHPESAEVEDPAGDESSKLVGVSTHQRLMPSDWCALSFERMLGNANHLGLYAEQTGLQFEVSRQ